MGREISWVFRGRIFFSCVLVVLLPQAVVAASPKDLDKGVELVFEVPAGALHNAASAGDLAKIKMLLARGADLQARAGNDATPLLFAAWNGKFGAVKLLLERGAEVNAKDSETSTPLHYAAIKGFADVAELLIAHGANLNARDNNGCMPLHDAVSHVSKKVAEVLLAHGAEVNATCGTLGATPLHMAVQKLDAELVTLLLEHGANVNAEFEIGLTPLGLAFRMVREGDSNPKLRAVIGLLASNGGDPVGEDRVSSGGYHYVNQDNLAFIVDSLPDGFVTAGDNRDFSRLLLLATDDETSPEVSGQILAKFSPLAKRRELQRIIESIEVPSAWLPPVVRAAESIAEGESTRNRGMLLDVAIKLAQAINPPPVIPDKALQRFAEGNVEFKTAESEADLRKAEACFFQAVNLAPWWPEAYYNLALVQEKRGVLYPEAGWYKTKSDGLYEAVWNYRYYLLAAPEAPDVKTVKIKIYELESLSKKRN